jgi:hypothetical protein
MKNQLDRPAATCVAVKDSLPDIPHYLQAHYWWAYVHPRAVHVFERQWLVNLILWGNYKRLCNAVLHDYGHDLSGRTLQIACAYGDLTPRLVDCVAPGGSLEIVDILPIQLENLAKKLPKMRRSSCIAWIRRRSALPTPVSTGHCCSSCCTSSRRRCAKELLPRRYGWSVRAAR